MHFAIAGLSLATFATLAMITGTTPTHARGAFDVKVTPQTIPGSADSSIAAMSIAKQYHGDLEGSGTGEMLANGTGAANSVGAYVALEIVKGTLLGKHGSFVLQHAGTMSPGKISLVITIVPGSGTGDLAGISGSMTIIIADGKHSYDLEYALPGN